MIVLIQNQKTDYKIAIPDDASIVEKKAAEELALYLEKTYGVLLPVCKENEITDNAIYVGHTIFAKVNGIKGDNIENWHVCICGRNVVLTGGITNKDRGVIYSVYHFLEDIVGIRWWSWFEEYIPEANILCIQENYKNSGTPFFEYRNIADSFSVVDLPYIMRNRLNAWCDDILEEGAGHPEFVARGGIKHIGFPGNTHTLPKMIPIDMYYDEHPEWFAYDELSNSRLKTDRRQALYCLTNESLIQFTAEKAIEYIDKNIQEAEKNGLEMPCFFSVTMADMEGYCQCEKCKEVNEKSGKTGYNLKFVNAVAEIVEKKYPEIPIETLVYWDYIEPPKDDTVPAKNVLIRLADLKIDLLRDIESPTNREEMRLLTQWGTLCKKNDTKLYIWDYYLQQYPNCMMPYFLKLQKNFKYFYENQGRGCFIEHETSHISDFWTMTQWLLTRVMENPYQDFNALIDDFTTRYYGDAATYIKEYIDLLDKNLSENACRIMVFEQAVLGNYVNYKTIRDGMEILLKAEKAVKNDKLCLSRVHTVMSCLYRTLMLRYEEFQTIAQKHNETINISKQSAAELVISYLEENAHVYAKQVEGKILNENVVKAVEGEIAFIKRYLEKPNPIIETLDELLKYGTENVYAISGTKLIGMAGCGMLPGGHQMGEMIEWSNERSRDVLKISPREMPTRRMYQHLAGKKDDDTPNPLRFYTDGYGENTVLELFQEDLLKEQYHLYKIGKVKGVSQNSATMLRLFDYLGYCVGISCLYEVFPSDTYGIYIDLKVTGEGYGGNIEEQDALYIDAIYLVNEKSN